MNRIFLSSIAVYLLAASALASGDPFVGRWVLNPHHSKYPPGTCPKKMMIEMEAAGDGIRYRSDTTYSNGNKIQANYLAQYNGTEAIVVGVRGMLLPVSLKKINSHTVVAYYRRFLQLVATSRRVVSPDGRTMTITTTSEDAAGRRITTVGVYDKEAETANAR